MNNCFDNQHLPKGYEERKIPNKHRIRHHYKDGLDCPCINYSSTYLPILFIIFFYSSPVLSQ